MLELIHAHSTVTMGTMSFRLSEGPDESYQYQEQVIKYWWIAQAQLHNSEDGRETA